MPGKVPQVGVDESKVFVDVGHHEDGLRASEVDPVSSVFGLDPRHARLVPVPLVNLADGLDNLFAGAHFGNTHLFQVLFRQRQKVLQVDSVILKQAKVLPGIDPQQHVLELGELGVAEVKAAVR